jgi:hypothetical protein
MPRRYKEKVQLKTRWGKILYTSDEPQSVAETVQEACEKGVCLTNVDLRGANLQKLYLVGASLKEADLGLANLRGANLHGATLTCVDLTGANLAETDLTEANLCGANLSDANLSKSFLTYANLAVAVLFDANLTDTQFDEINLSGAHISGAKFGRYVCSGKFLLLNGVAEWGSILAYETYGRKQLRIICGCHNKTFEQMANWWYERSDRRMSRMALQMIDDWYKNKEYS